TKQLLEPFLDIVEFRPSPNAGVTVVRPDGHIAYSVQPRHLVPALKSVRSVLERQTEAPLLSCGGESRGREAQGAGWGGVGHTDDSFDQLHPGGFRLRLRPSGPALRCATPPQLRRGAWLFSVDLSRIASSVWRYLC